MSFFCCECPSTAVQTKENNIKLKKIDHFLYKQSDIIGKGQFSEVYIGTDQETGKQVAIKVIKVGAIKSKIDYNMVQCEINITKQLKHPNIINYYNSFNSPNNCYIILQNCSKGDLEKYIKVRGGLNQNQATKIAYDIFKGLFYLNSKHIIHRDLKLSNIFIDQEGSAKIGDFGFAVQSEGKFTDASIGSPLYMSPEALSKCEYGPKTDIWSYGIILYEMLHNEVPYCCQSLQQLKERILNPPIFRVQISRELRELIQLCLNANQASRVTIDEIKQHSFIKKCRRSMDKDKLKKGNVIDSNGMDRLTYLTHSLLARLVPEQFVAFIQYCRLMSKVLLKFPSLILSQWLLTLSQTLTKVSLEARGEKGRKLRDLARDYYSKYQEEHKVFRMSRSIKDAVEECQSLCRSPYKDKGIEFLLEECKLLKKSIENESLGEYVKFTRTEHFLKEIQA